jgi:hypothetical protein
VVPLRGRYLVRTVAKGLCLTVGRHMTGKADAASGGLVDSQADNPPMAFVLPVAIPMTGKADAASGAPSGSNGSSNGQPVGVEMTRWVSALDVDPAGNWLVCAGGAEGAHKQDKFGEYF